VEKYVMTDDEYNARDNTYRKFKEQKLKEDPTWTLKKEMAKARGEEVAPPPPKDPEAYKAEAEKIKVRD
jgi:tubulin-specific chaperone B